MLAESYDNLLTLAAVHHPWLLMIGEEIVGLDNLIGLRKRLPDENVSILVFPKDRQEGMRGYAHGADMYLSKPFNPQELVQFVRRLRGRWEQENLGDATVVNPENTGQ